MKKSFDEKKKKTQDDLRKLLADPKYRGRVVKPSEIYRNLKIGKTTFYKYVDDITLAQTWLTENQDAPVDAKKHYQNMLETSINGIEKTVHITSGGKSGSQGKNKFYVSRNEARMRTKHASEMIRPSVTHKDGKTERHRVVQTGVTVREVSNETVVVEVTEEDKIIDKIREQFVLAPLGELPNVTQIMKDVGLLKDNGDPANPKITEAVVRERMVSEDWKNEREMVLHRAFDIIPNEVKMVTMMRNLDTQKLLYNEIKLIHRMNAQHYRTGQVKSLDGNTILDYSPDHGTIAGMAEVMRRMVDGGTNIKILINQFDSKEQGSSGSMSLVSRNYLRKLGEMTPEEVEQEARRLEDLAQMLADDPQGKISIDEIEAQERQVIDVPASDIKK